MPDDGLDLLILPSDFESDFMQKKLHPTDLKQTVANYLIKIIQPIREKLVLNKELVEIIKKSA